MAVKKYSLSAFLYFCLAIFFLVIGELIPDQPTRILLSLFIFRYYRLLVGIVAYFLHRPVSVSNYPVFLPHDVSVILPTVNPESVEFLSTVYSVLNAGVARLIVVLPLDGLKRADLLEHDDLAKAYLTGRLRLECCYSKNNGRQKSIANKRQQVATGLEVVEYFGDTSVVIFVDDHVEWPTNFLSHILAPFANNHIGGVAMWKCVKRRECTKTFMNLTNQLYHSLWSDHNYTSAFTNLGQIICHIWLDFWNFIGCLYLERHNFDITASHFVDRGIFVISGRTAAYRSEIVCTPEFREAFCNETWLGVGPLNADDDNFITRWLIKRGWQIAWQHGPAATMYTTIGDTGFRKFNAQCMRWVRTTWRSNLTSLFVDRTVLHRQPWSVYAVYLTSFFNFALFTDAALLSLCWKCQIPLLYMATWIFCSKLVKPLPHFLRHPRDLVYLPFYILFGYYHSLLKLYALFTVRNIAWGSQPGLVR